MHVHRLWDNENECNKQCYQIEGNISFKRIYIFSNLLHFISYDKFLKNILKENEKKKNFVKDFFEKINFLPMRAFEFITGHMIYNLAYT